MADAVLDLLNRTEEDARRRILLKGGYVLSMDAGVGEFVGDVLIEGTTIAALGRDLGVDDDFDGVVVDAAGAIVIPGLVDSHTHGWQAALSGLMPDITLGQYMGTIHGYHFGAPGPPGIASCYEPEDMRIGNLMTSLRCLDSGITCFVDNSHNARTPEHSNASVEGLREARIRAVHAAGAPLDGTRADDWPGDILRLRDEYFGGAEELLTLRLFTDPDPGRFEFAREHGLWTSTETTAYFEGALDALFDAGLIGTDHSFNHTTGLSERIWQQFAERGATVNVCPRSDSAYLIETAVPPVAEALAHGVDVGVAMDAQVGYSVDMFAEMRTMLHLGRARSAPLTPGEDPSPPLLGNREVLRLATLGGAANAGLGDRIGSLVPGKAADVTVIRPDRLSLTPPGNLTAQVVSYATPAEVEAVFVAGGVRKWGGQLVGQDLPALLGRLEESRERLLAAFGLPLDPFGGPRP